jgi:ComEC/Rec2-related protein
MVRAFPALWLLGAIILGIGVADRTATPSWLFPLIALLLLVGGLVARRRWFGIALLLLGIGASSAAAHAFRYRPEGIRHIASVVECGPQATIYAAVSDWPILREQRTDIPLQVDSLLIDRQMYRVDGGVLLTVTDTTTILQRADRIIVRARVYPLLAAPRSGFDYSRYLSLRGMFGRVYLPTLLDVQIDRRSPVGALAMIDRFRDHIICALETCLTPNAAALAKGLLLGETRGIAPHVYAMFRDSGTLHLLAVSGSNVALVLLVFLVVIRPLRMPLVPRRLTMIAVIALYALLCHLEPSVVRASVMALLVVAARMLHRKVDLNQVIATAAVLILLWDSAQLFDVGFQLSFVTAWGLIFIVPRVTSLFELYHQYRWYRWLVFPLLISLTAQVVSTPLSILYFHRLPVISVPANLLVVPLVTLCVIGVACVLGAYAVHPLLGQMVGSWVDPAHRLTVWVLEQMGGERMPVIETSGMFLSQSGWLLAVLAYGVLILFTLALRNTKARRLAVLVSLVLCLTAVTAAAIRPPESIADKVFVHPVPGGFAAVRPLGDGVADLVIGSMIARNYPVDSTVLAPILARHKIDSIQFLFLLDVDFASLPELWRFATEHRADTVLIDQSRNARLADVVRLSGAGGVRPEVVTLIPLPPPEAGDGYFPLSEGLLLRFQNRGILFSLAAPTTESVGVGQLKSLALIIGRRWRPAPSDWLALSRKGIFPIAAGSIRPHLPEVDSLPTTSATELLPEFLVDLNRQGGIELTLIDNSWRPIQ